MLFGLVVPDYHYLVEGWDINVKKQIYRRLQDHRIVKYFKNNTIVGIKSFDNQLAIFKGTIRDSGD